MNRYFRPRTFKIFCLKIALRLTSKRIFNPGWKKCIFTKLNAKDGVSTPPAYKMTPTRFSWMCLKVLPSTCDLLNFSLELSSPHDKKISDGNISFQLLPEGLYVSFSRWLDVGCGASNGKRWLGEQPIRVGSTTRFPRKRWLLSVFRTEYWILIRIKADKEVGWIPWILVRPQPAFRFEIAGLQRRRMPYLPYRQGALSIPSSNLLSTTRNFLRILAISTLWVKEVEECVPVSLTISKIQLGFLPFIT